ncbi:MAG: hypothetical protein KFF72_17310 [Arthrospira sp. SH-MAG29]|nr:hypothetical protein [Arthrospira sp. SH-MAG29]MBS0018081.1 hypothetical protein [Arthrospira sp. SH-MAG29]
MNWLFVLAWVGGQADSDSKPLGVRGDRHRTLALAFADEPIVAKLG